MGSKKIKEKNYVFSHKNGYINKECKFGGQDMPVFTTVNSQLWYFLANPDNLWCISSESILKSIANFKGPK